MRRIYLKYALISSVCSFFTVNILAFTDEYPAHCSVKESFAGQLWPFVQNCILLFPIFILLYFLSSRFIKQGFSFTYIHSSVLVLLCYYLLAVIVCPFPFSPLGAFLDQQYTMVELWVLFKRDFIKVYTSYKLLMMSLIPAHLSILISLVLDYKKYNEFANRT